MSAQTGTVEPCDICGDLFCERCQPLMQCVGDRQHCEECMANCPACIAAAAEDQAAEDYLDATGGRCP